MFINELAEPSLVVIYPGRFQPFHRGHHAVYEWLTGRFGRNNVYIATSAKQEGDRSPFSFSEKAYFMQLTGVPSDRIVQATQPYQIDSIQQAGLDIADPSNTVVIFAVSEKDMAEDPRFSFRTKKDGSAPYFQPLKDIKDTESMEKHAYIMTVPTFQFDVAGDPMQSATELRAEYRRADPQKKQLIIKDLFGRYTREAEQIMDMRLPSLATMQEEAAGVGVVRGGKDPRYMTATMGDQNDVNSKTLGKMMRAYNLVGVKAPKSGQTPVKKNIGTGIRESEDQDLQDDPAAHAEVYHSASVNDKNEFLNRRDELYQKIIDPKERWRLPELKRELQSLQFQGRVKGFLEGSEPYQQAIDRLSDAEMAKIDDKIDRILARFATEKLPDAYKEKLKAEVDRLKDIKINMMLGRPG